jgi:hypothetical protein
MKDALLELMSRRGLAHTYARELHHRLRERGLMQVENHGAIATFAGGSPGADLQQANYQQVHDAAIEAGLVTEAEFEEVMLLLSDPKFTAFTSTMFSAMGRKVGDKDVEAVELRPQVNVSSKARANRACLAPGSGTRTSSYGSPR